MGGAHPARMLHFSSLFVSYDDSKSEIRCQSLKGDFKVPDLLASLILKRMAKEKLAILIFLCCGEIVES